MCIRDRRERESRTHSPFSDFGLKRNGLLDALGQHGHAPAQLEQRERERFGLPRDSDDDGLVQ
eukprot:1962549-Rhodomonas_salina.1